MAEVKEQASALCSIPLAKPRECVVCGCLVGAHHGPNLGCEGGGGTCKCDLTQQMAEYCAKVYRKRMALRATVASHAPATAVTVDQAREWRQVNWYDKVPAQLDEALAAFANSVIDPEADSPAPSAPLGTCDLWASKLHAKNSHKAAACVNWKAASATQSSREFVLEKHPFFEVSARCGDYADECSYAHSSPSEVYDLMNEYAASLRSEVETLKAANQFYVEQAGKFSEAYTEEHEKVETLKAERDSWREVCNQILTLRGKNKELERTVSELRAREGKHGN